MILSNYKQLGGKHPETAGFKNMLAYQGVKAPQSGIHCVLLPFARLPLRYGWGGRIRTYA